MEFCDNRITNLEKNDPDEFDPIVAATLCFKTHGANSKIPRRCTDIGCLVLLVIMIIIDLVILGVALSNNANPEHLWKGHGYHGEICGDHQRTAWVNISYPDITQCVSNCDAVTAYNAIPFEYYWCVPDEHDRKSNDFKFDEGSATYTRTVADLYTLWKLVFTVSLTGSIIISLIYLYMISINRRLLSYVIMNIVFGSLAGIFLILHGYKDWKSELTDDTAIIEIIFGVFILGLVTMIGAWFRFARERLKTEIEMIAEAIQALTDNWCIIVFCIIYGVFILGFFVYWVVSALFIYSVPDSKTYSIPNALKGTITDTDKYVLFNTANYKYALIYHMIFAFYGLFVFCYVGYLVVSHVILVWYLGKRAPQHREDEDDKEDKEGKGDRKSRQSQRIWEALTTIMLYHVGTASFAALSLFCLSDIPTAYKRWIYPICKDMKCCKKKVNINPSISSNHDINNEWHCKMCTFINKATSNVCQICDAPKTNEDDEKYNKEKKDGDDKNRDRTHTIEMNEIQNHQQEIRKQLMYNDIKQEIFPLIEEKIQKLSIEYAITEVINKKMDSITCKHYYIPNAAIQHDDNKEEENKEDNNDVDSNNEEKERVNNYDASNDNDVGNVSKLNTVNILDMIKDNITNFNYEKSIKEDIYKIIEQKYKKLSKEVKIKQEIHGIEYKLKQRVENKKSSTVGIHHEYDKIRKEGLIFTSLYGTSFCYSSYRASKLEKQNITRLANVEGFSQYNERFGRIGIASSNTAIAVIWMFILDSLYNHISSFIMPSLIVFMVSYTIGYIFTMILEVTVSTLLFCVILNEKQWKKRFAINQGKIKQNVTKLGNGLSAMLSEHLLIMQLKETEVNEKIGEFEVKKYVLKNDKNLDEYMQRKKIKILRNRLFEAKKDALSTEKALLCEIDGAIKLTEYLINVILVENLFNKRYKDIKPNQEIARRDHTKDIFDKEKYSQKSSKQIKKDLYKKVKEKKTIQNFLDFYPIRDKKCDLKSDETVLETEWKDVIKNLEIKLVKNGIKHFKMTGAKQKGIQRAFYKSFYSYHQKDDGFRYLTDMLRCSFVFDDFDNLYKCFKEIYSMKNEFEILRVKDRFNTASEPCGYRDFMLNVFVKNNQIIDGIICEIQLHHKQFYNAKKISHKMYKKTRLFEKDGGNEAYKYAVKYIRPVIGRFKIYPIDEEEIEEIDILKIIGKKIEKLGSKYYQQHIKPILDSNKFIINYDKSKLANNQKSIILPPPSNQGAHKMDTITEQQQHNKSISSFSYGHIWSL